VNYLQGRRMKELQMVQAHEAARDEVFRGGVVERHGETDELVLQIREVKQQMGELMHQIVELKQQLRQGRVFAVDNAVLAAVCVGVVVGLVMALFCR